MSELEGTKAVVVGREPRLRPRHRRSARREVGPTVVVLNAGAAPQVALFREQTWDAFSTNWNADVKIVFQWLTAIVDEPLADGSSVVTLSSGAALRGSPLSGGYAGVKAMVAFLTEFVAQDVARMKLRIRFATRLPTICPEGDVGRQAVEAYARRQGRTVERFGWATAVSRR